MEPAARAAQILVESEAILRGGHFVYVTGEHGDGWVAKDAVFPHTDRVDELCGMLAAAVSGREFDYVCGPATGGLIVAQWVAHHLRLPAVFAEHAKEEGYVPGAAGTGPLRAPFVLRRGYDDAVRGKRVLVVDDVVNTGLSVRETADAVRAAGGEVVTVACLCTRGKRGAGRRGQPGLRVAGRGPGALVAGRGLPSLPRRRAREHPVRARRGLPGPAGRRVTVAGVALDDADRAILALEGPTVVGHTCKVILVGRGAPGPAELRESIAARLGAAPALTRRLGGPEEAPEWVPDPGFDVAEHVVAAGDGAPVPRAALRAHVARLFAEHLDRARPLWRIDSLALDDGTTALIWRLHHALADGTASMRLARAMLWDAVPTAEPPPHQADTPAGDAADERAPPGPPGRLPAARVRPLGGAVALRRAHRPAAPGRVRLGVAARAARRGARSWPAPRSTTRCWRWWRARCGPGSSTITATWAGCACGCRSACTTRATRPATATRTSRSRCP